MPLPIALIDTHSHIYAEEFDADRDKAIRRTREAGVERPTPEWRERCSRRSTPKATSASSTSCAAIRTAARR